MEQGGIRILPGALHKSGSSTQTARMPDIPSAPSCQETNAGDAHTLTLVTGVYNERPVKRGEFSLPFEFIGHWDELLARMNAGKRGRPFQYLEEFGGSEGSTLDTDLHPGAPGADTMTGSGW